MARKSRIHRPGAVYHVIQRGNDRKDIFLDEQDRHRFYEILKNACERFGCRILAFCLMTNHIHLAVLVDDIPLSRIMQNLSQRYTQWYNWRQQKSGHVFQGRYKAVMVDGDAYLLELAAYLHLNPIRANLSERPEDYPWSSHRAYLGKERLAWLETETLLSRLSFRVEKARGLFDEFVEGRIAEGRRKEFHGEEVADSRIFGDDDFVEKALAQEELPPIQKPDINAILAAIRVLYAIDDDLLAAQNQKREASEARSLAAWATLELGSGTLAELASRVGRDPSTLSCAIRRLEKRREKDSQLSERMERLRRNLCNLQAFKA